MAITCGNIQVFLSFVCLFFPWNSALAEGSKCVIHQTFILLSRWFEYKWTNYHPELATSEQGFAALKAAGDSKLGENIGQSLDVAMGAAFIRAGWHVLMKGFSYSWVALAQVQLNTTMGHHRAVTPVNVGLLCWCNGQCIFYLSASDLCDDQNNINPNILKIFQTDAGENSAVKTLKNLVLGRDYTQCNPCTVYVDLLL